MKENNSYRPYDITIRVRTFEDAARVIGEHHWLVQSCAYATDSGKSAFCKLRVIVAALNEGWHPSYTKEEERHAPIFTLFTVEELEALPRHHRTELTTYPIRESYNVDYDYIAIRYGVHHTENMQPVMPNSLLLKNRDLAYYCGKQFIGLWARYLLAPRKGGSHD